MNRLDYMVQVEDLHASPELRARITALAGEAKRPRRRFRPWMGVCAALALVVLGGAWLLPRMGGSTGGGGSGHDEASTFMSYAGPVFPPHPEGGKRQHHGRAGYHPGLFPLGTGVGGIGVPGGGRLLE